MLLEGGMFETNNHHEIKIAILLNFFYGELYFYKLSFKLMSWKNKLSDILSLSDNESQYVKTTRHLTKLLTILNSSFPKSVSMFSNNNSGITFKDMKKISTDAIDELKSIDTTSDTSDPYYTLADNFLTVCNDFEKSRIEIFGADFTDYMEKFLFSNAKAVNKLTADNIKNIIIALTSDQSGFDNYKLKYSYTGDRFTKDIALMCGSKIILMDKIIDYRRLLKDKEKEEKFDSQMTSLSSTYTSAEAVGGKKSKKLPKKEILGKTKSIHKIMGDRKEYVKHKGKLITIKDYKELMKKKK